MKITETITRDCCQTKDLKPFLGRLHEHPALRKYSPHFCVHCGQLWLSTDRMDAAGDKESILEPFEFDFVVKFDMTIERTSVTPVANH